MELDRDLTDNAVMGIVAVAKTMGFWWKVCVETQAIFREQPPDVFFSVDFPGLNGRLALWATKRGIPTVHLVPPAVWAYAPWRLPRWRRAVKRMLTVFPFEPPLLEGSGIECVNVGHPLFEAPLPEPRTPECWPGDRPCIIELLPGSRSQEIRRHAPVLLDAALRVKARMPHVSFVVRLAHERHRELFEETLRDAPARPDALEVLVGEPVGFDALPLLGALATSGTVTAELGTALVPHCLFYRLSHLMWVVAQGGVTAPWFGLVNLIAGQEVAPERLLVRKEGDIVADDFLRVAGTAEAWTETRKVLRERVRIPIAMEGVADRAARAVLETRV